MIPIEKVQDLIARHDDLEKELSSGNIDPKLFAQKSKEYSSLKEIINAAREYLNFDDEKKGLEEILNDKSNDNEIIKIIGTYHIKQIIDGYDVSFYNQTF